MASKPIQTFDVKPEEPVERYDLFLNSIDQRFGFYVRNLYFYKDNPGTNVLLHNLKNSLSKLLVPYHFYAGRLRFNEEKKTMECIDCNNAGALLVHAVSELSLEDVTADEINYFFAELPDAKSLEELPLLVIQVTEMKNSGYAIGILNHHTLTDAISGLTIQLNWASLTRGEGLCVVPSADRSRFTARDPPTPKFDHFEFAKQIDRPDSRFRRTVESILASEKAVLSAPKKARKVYFFSFERLASIKKKTLEGDGSCLTTCTTFEALAALVWKARASCISKGLHELVRLRFVIDARKIVKPPLDDGFCGNAVYFANALLPLKDLVNKPLSEIVRCIQQAKEKVTGEYVQSGLDFLDLHPDFWHHQDCDVTINAWPRMMEKALDLDFTWGKPVRVEYPKDPRNNSIFFLPFNRKGIDVSVSLDSMYLPIFEKNLTF